MQDTAGFSNLTPDTVIAAVEDALDIECSSMCRPLNSYINRVYEVAHADGEQYVAKFYRPGRWSAEALQDELDFLHELAVDEVPVVPPIPGPDGDLLHELGNTQFAVFPKKGGRPLDEPSVKDWEPLRAMRYIHFRTQAILCCGLAPCGKSCWLFSSVIARHFVIFPSDVKQLLSL